MIWELSLIIYNLNQREAYYNAESDTQFENDNKRRPYPDLKYRKELIKICYNDFFEARPLWNCKRIWP